MSTIATSSCSGGPTVSQRKLPISGTRDVGANFEAELLGVEGECFVLVVHPDLGGSILHCGVLLRG